ncbi:MULTISPECIES: Lrp/AsnC family transcriptional regulator [Haloferax]|uniref:Winged helix-turn-helix transcriptional regulator n=2 Tax=Haloferax TaxID=2251 RepID=A0A6G1Z6I2_9EURY|nr:MULTISPECIES: Lrp/AsnC family transcriptional regulator [Haloferax]KAB1185438.1 Lrp/AsnC family transcriptional regulator [Haloferax sp. CBA1149]MRW82085.1 winged helix-turn-helix transcriptional regulator [Haloferax marinisediminis]
MDDRDIEILNAVFELEDPSPKEVGDVTGIPKSTVHYRLKKLREDGIIKNDLFAVDLEKINLDLTIITEVDAQYREGYHKDVGNALSTIEGVNQVYFTMGDTDFIVIAHLPSRDKVEELIEQYEVIEGVERTSSKFVISTIKNEPHPLRDFTLETLRESILSDE